VRVGSTFSGVGGLDLGLARAGHVVAFQIEIDPFRRAVLARHWPDVPQHDDVRTFDPEPWRGRIDLLCGGFPCQDVSVAGQRAGLDGGTQSILFYEFARIADRVVGPGGFVLVENVAGLLASHRGRDFAHVLARLADLGFHDLAWRVLDSRYFGVPQRRRRVFILGRRGDGDRAARLLLESDGGGGNSPTRHAPATEPRPRVGGDPAPDCYYVEDFRNGTLTSDPGRTDRKPLVIVGAPPDADRMRTPTGDAGRMDMARGIRGKRYAAAGDAVTVTVAEWIGRRLQGGDDE
jgi:DNA (cytosine-5)-methyltransferase 1